MKNTRDTQLKKTKKMTDTISLRLTKKAGANQEIIEWINEQIKNQGGYAPAIFEAIKLKMAFDNQLNGFNINMDTDKLNEKERIRQSVHLEMLGKKEQALTEANVSDKLSDTLGEKVAPLTRIEDNANEGPSREYNAVNKNGNNGPRIMKALKSIKGV